MADAKKCDRCGAYYHVREPNIFKELAAAFCLEQEFEKLYLCVDLCDLCRRSYRKWFRGKENGEDDDPKAAD